MLVTIIKKNHPSFWKKSDYCEIGYSIYIEIWDEKSNNNSTAGQQHAPTENTMGLKNMVYQSLEFIAASYIACQNLTVEETGDLFYYNKIIAVFAETYNDVTMLVIC